MHNEHAAQFDALTIVSPMIENGEAKNQDRARWFEAIGVAALGDGTTGSAYGAEAADFVVDWSPTIYSGRPKSVQLEACADFLNMRRRLAQARDLQLADSIPQALRPLLIEVAGKQLANSYQTTLIAARFAATHCGVSIDAVRCGDSALYAFTEQGKLILVTPACKSVATAVLPDHVATGRWENLIETFPTSTHFVLASDGFYEAFASPHEIWTWLTANAVSLRDAIHQAAILEALHTSLASSKGDDDISFIWLAPRNVLDQEPTAAARDGVGADSRD